MDAVPVLENVEAERTVGIHVWMEHATDEAHMWRLVRIGFVKGEHQLERSCPAIIFDG